MCHGNHGFHDRAMDQLYLGMSKELFGAKQELKHLNDLCKEIMWYNFEINSHKWGGPWRKHNEHACLSLHGFSLTQIKKHGRVSYPGQFPIWYEGLVANAPQLPPEIIINELNDQVARVEAMEAGVHDAYDYAPGGRKYLQLVRDTLVGKPISDATVNHGE